MTEGDLLIKRYILLVLSLAEHEAEYLDTYFGPEFIRKEAKQRGKVDLEALVMEAGDLLSRIRESDQFEAGRRDFLEAQLKAVETTLRMQRGESLTVEEKVENIYGFRPERVDENEFEEGNRLLDDSLPGKGPIAERSKTYHDSMRIPVEDLENLCKFVLHELRDRTRQRFGLPDGEQCALQMVKDRPYGGYSSYKGAGLSILEINTDQPFYLHYLPVFIAHEIYPGHHTESSLQDVHLIQGQDRQELCAVPSLSPQVFVSEMIATHAREMTMSDDELEAWLRYQLLPRSKLKVSELGKPAQVEKAQRMLAPVAMNAVFMYWNDGAGEEEIKEYIKRYRHYTEEEAVLSARWVAHPVFHVYTFSYYPGYQLLEGVLSRSRDPYQDFATASTTSSVPIPPATTAATGPSKAAAV
jgi:hypothetical protein